MKALDRRRTTTTSMNVLCASQCAPEASRAEIGRRCGVTRERVRQILGNSGRRMGNPVLPRVQLICEYCSKTYTRLPRQIELQNRHGTPTRFCSKSCQGKYYSPPCLDSNLHYLKCLHCGADYQIQETVYEQRAQRGGTKYCSRKCYHDHRWNRDTH